MSDDIVAKLERWAEDIRRLSGPSVDPEMLQRARDEIVALREMRDAHVRILSASLDKDEEKMRRWIAKARDEALEQAARLHEQVYVGHHQDPIAAVIEYRDLILTLKDKHE